MDADLEFDGPFDDDDIEMEDDEDEVPKRRNPLRVILLVLVILVLLCVVCYAGSQLFGDTIVGIIPIPQLQSVIGAETPAVIPVGTTELPATEELPPDQTSEPAPTEEPTAPPDTDEQPATTEPAEEPVEPTEEPTMEPTEEPPEATPTTAPVPGPTATPTLTPPSDTAPEAEPTIVVTAESCENNTPPVAEANGPYDAMMGKGQAFVVFDATGSSDPDGMIIKYEWEFGDNSAPGSGDTVTHGYTNIGNYVAILTVTDDCNATGQDTAEVTIIGPTPPAPGDTPTPTPTSTGTPPPADVTLGFCYLVQYGDTLSGIAWYYGIPLQDLAAVNGVNLDYFVVAGQGLFIPMSEITDGPNAYQVQANDTLNVIAYQCGMTTTALAEANGLDTNATLTPGEIIIIPLGR